MVGGLEGVLHAFRDIRRIGRNQPCVEPAALGRALNGKNTLVGVPAIAVMSRILMNENSRLQTFVS
jgi:hypothetical protein